MHGAAPCRTKNAEALSLGANVVFRGDQRADELLLVSQRDQPLESAKLKTSFRIGCDVKRLENQQAALTRFEFYLPVEQGSIRDNNLLNEAIVLLCRSCYRVHCLMLLLLLVVLRLDHLNRVLLFEDGPGGFHNERVSQNQVDLLHA